MVRQLLVFSLLSVVSPNVAFPTSPNVPITGPTIVEFATPTSNSGLLFITTGPDHNLWFTEQNTSKIGKVVLP